MVHFVKLKCCQFHGRACLGIYLHKGAGRASKLRVWRSAGPVPPAPNKLHCQFSFAAFQSHAKLQTCITAKNPPLSFQRAAQKHCHARSFMAANRCCTSSSISSSSSTGAGRLRDSGSLGSLGPPWPHVARWPSGSASSSPMGVFHHTGPPNFPSPEAQDMQPDCTSGVMRCCAPRLLKGTLHAAHVKLHVSYPETRTPKNHEWTRKWWNNWSQWKRLCTRSP